MGKQEEAYNNGRFDTIITNLTNTGVTSAERFNNSIKTTGDKNHALCRIVEKTNLFYIQNHLTDEAVVTLELKDDSTVATIRDDAETYTIIPSVLEVMSRASHEVC